MTSRFTKSLFTTFLALLILAWAAYALDFPKWFPFDQENALDEWQEKIFKDKVLYVVETTPQEGHLSAQSHEACSGLLYKMKLDVHKYPLISWSWMVSQFPAKTIEEPEKGGWIEKDDYAARVYIIFSSWNVFNTKSLEYIWDEEQPVGTVLTSPFFENIKLIVVESGKDNLNNWVAENRNIYEDYKLAFGSPPPRYAQAIALMTDSDNTLSTAEAYYKDLKVGYTDESSEQ